MIRGAGHVGAVQFFTQIAAGCELHHRQITRHLERELVPRLAFGLRGGQCGLLNIIRHASKLVLGCVVGVGVGRIQCVFAEFLAQLGLAFLDLGEALFRGAGQFCTAEHKVTHGIQMGLALLR
ncbi:hypothetical protein D3C86_1830250 [compost metagenome]